MKRLEIVREVAPNVRAVGVVVNPDNPPSVLEGKDVPAAARASGLEAKVLTATTDAHIKALFDGIERERIDALWFCDKQPLMATPRRIAHSDDRDHSFRRIATTCSNRSRPV
jgi:ABC-type uncharacterized transport system substrate-binding protein